MARMIPAVIDPGTPSPGERDAFRRLESDPVSSEWTVIHSLYLPNHVRQVSGELDFLLLIPGAGILVLEIKAAATIARREGLWFYGKDPKGDPRGPFRQAADGMHSLRGRLAKRYPPVSKAVFWSAVVLPYTRLDFNSEEWHDWQLIDTDSYRSGSLAESCLVVLQEARRHLATTGTARWFDPESAIPSVDDCRNIARILRPDFEAFQSPRARREETQSELKRYTEEQFAALDAMALNPRVVFQGPAGTGKTLLAIECAQRAASAGKRTLLLCFNRLLGAWLRTETQGLGDAVWVGTLHSYMLSLTGDTDPLPAGPAFWEHELPDRALQRLLEEEGLARFDVLVVDEAQDVLSSSYLDVLDMSIAGGLSGGEWRLFGDFERQAIYGRNGESLDTVLAARGEQAPVYSLRVNCRNRPRVATLVRVLSHLDPYYARVLRSDDGVEPDLRFYSSKAQALDKLTGILGDLRAEGYRGSDVVILSPRASDSLAESISTQPWRDRLRPLGSATGNHTLYGTIHSFKGMEAPAVVVTDISDVEGDMAEALFYVAVTRPTDRLVLLIDEAARPAVGRLLTSMPARKDSDA